jgi:hypothetical protein
MASTGKRKTTMAKLNRERRLLERRHEKQARKDARKRAAAEEPEMPGEMRIGPPAESGPPAASAPPEVANGQPETVVQEQ